MWHGGSTPRAAPALCHLIPDPQPLTPLCRSHCRHARAVQSVDSCTLDFALLLAGRRRVIAELAGRPGSAGAAAAWPPLRAGWTCKRLPKWRCPRISQSHHISVPVVTRALTMPLVTRHPRVVRFLTGRRDTSTRKGAHSLSNASCACPYTLALALVSKGCRARTDCRARIVCLCSPPVQPPRRGRQPPPSRPTLRSHRCVRRGAAAAVDGLRSQGRG